MNVGSEKGAIVTSLIASVRPALMVELGGYVGYSALLFGDAVRAAAPSGTTPRYYSIEMDPVFAAIVMSLVDLAGLSDVVKVVTGASGDALKRLHQEGKLGKGNTGGVDLLFLDHVKPLYVDDLKLCEELGIIKEGTAIAADNVIKPGNPPYLEYVRMSVQEKKKKSGKGGNPALVYTSELKESFEPTGIPVSTDVSVDDGVGADSDTGWRGNHKVCGRREVMTETRAFQRNEECDILQIFVTVPLVPSPFNSDSHACIRPPCTATCRSCESASSSSGSRSA